jgi:hypothetical protein
MKNLNGPDKRSGREYLKKYGNSGLLNGSGSLIRYSPQEEKYQKIVWYLTPIQTNHNSMVIYTVQYPTTMNRIFRKESNNKYDNIKTNSCTIRSFIIHKPINCF